MSLLQLDYDLKHAHELRQAAFKLYASLGSTDEEIRKKVNLYRLVCTFRHACNCTHTHWYPAVLFIFCRSQKLRTWWTELSVVCQSPASKCVWQLSGMTSFCFSLLSCSETDSDFNGFLAFIISLRAVWKCWVVSAPSILHQWKLNTTGHVSCEQITFTHIFVCAYCIHKYIYVWMYVCVHIYTYAYLLITHTTIRITQQK